MARGLFARALGASRLARLVSRLYRDRLTARGRYVLWLSAALAFVGLIHGPHLGWNVSPSVA